MAKKDKKHVAPEPFPGITTIKLGKDSRQKTRRWHFLVFLDDMMFEQDTYTIGDHRHALEAAKSLKADTEAKIPEKKVTIKLVPGETLSPQTHKQLIGMLQQENVLRRSLALAIKDHRDKVELPESDEIYILDLKRRAIEILKGMADPKLPEPEPVSAIIDPNTMAPAVKDAPALVTV